MEKRIILAFILSFAVLYGFRALFSPPEPTSRPPASAQIPTPPGANPSVESAEPVGRASPDRDIRADKPEDLVVDTPLYTATVSNIGGVLKSYKLKAYSDADGHPIELIDEKSANKVGWPLALATGDTVLDELLTKASFVARREGDRISLEFAAKGVDSQKIVQFDPKNYGFSLTVKVTNGGRNVSPAVVWQAGFGDPMAADSTKRNAVYEVDGAFKRIGLGSIKEEQSLTAVRAGVEDQYFLAMFLSPENPLAVKVNKQEFTGADGKAVPELHVSARMPDSKPLRVYVGPKNRDWLSAADPRLASVVSYGWFEFIARPLLFGLLFIHTYIGNFGWSIILLTLAINFLLFPLRLKQQISMQQMQKIQPQMKTLQDKYKKLKSTDPRRADLQKEMMQLYKEHGVNPMGGCLPLLLQMPVFFGLYSMLSVSIELRGAPWILWIKDLSQPEHLWLPVLPVLMAVSMVIQQKMTPTTVDPAQAKMMMIMPVMFLFMFLRVQSGLTLYWLTSNLVGIGQQFFINKYWSTRSDSTLRARSKLKEPRDK